MKRRCGNLLKIFGMTGWGCRCTPSAWSVVGSSGRHRLMVLSLLPPRSSAICWKASTGDIHNGPGDRRWPAEC